MVADVVLIRLGDVEIAVRIEGEAVGVRDPRERRDRTLPVDAPYPVRRRVGDVLARPEGLAFDAGGALYPAGHVKSARAAMPPLAEKP